MADIIPIKHAIGEQDDNVLIKSFSHGQRSLKCLVILVARRVGVAFAWFDRSGELRCVSYGESIIWFRKMNYVEIQLGRVLFRCPFCQREPEFRQGLPQGLCSLLRIRNAA